MAIARRPDRKELVDLHVLSTPDLTHLIDREAIAAVRQKGAQGAAPLLLEVELIVSADQVRSAIPHQDQLVLAGGYVARARQRLSTGDDVIGKRHVGAVDGVIAATGMARHHFFHHDSPLGRLM